MQFIAEIKAQVAALQLKSEDLRKRGSVLRGALLAIAGLFYWQDRASWLWAIVCYLGLDLASGVKAGA